MQTLREAADNVVVFERTTDVEFFACTLYATVSVWNEETGTEELLLKEVAVGMLSNIEYGDSTGFN